MKAARVMRWARRAAGLSQRALSEKTGIPQSTIARIEAGAVDPRVGTLTSLLRACGYDLELESVLGRGVDRSLIRAMLELPPAERLQRAAEGAQFLDTLRSASSAERQAGTG